MASHSTSRKQRLLADFEGRVTILGEPLQRVLGYAERAARNRG